MFCYRLLVASGGLLPTTLTTQEVSGGGAGGAGWLHFSPPSLSPSLPPSNLPFNSSLRCRDVPSRYISILLSEFKLLLSSALIFILPLIEKINSNWVKCYLWTIDCRKNARNEQLQSCQLGWWERQGPICHLSSQLLLYYFFCLRQLENVFTAQTVYIQIYEEKRMTPNLGKCQKIKRLSPHYCRAELGREISNILHILFIGDNIYTLYRVRGRVLFWRQFASEGRRGELWGGWRWGGVVASDIDSLAGGSHHIPGGRPAELHSRYHQPHLEI